MIFAQGRGKEPPPLIMRGKRGGPLHYPTIRAEPLEVECLDGASPPLRLNTSAGNGPHQSACHSAGTNQWSSTRPYSNEVTASVQGSQCESVLSAGTTPIFHSPQSTGYVRREMTPGKARGMDEPSRVGGAQGAVRSVFKQGKGGSIPTSFGPLVIPPPQRSMGGTGRGGLPVKEHPCPPPVPTDECGGILWTRGSVG